MKIMLSLLIIAFQIISIQPEYDKARTEKNIVTLTAKQVDGANDIEEAIISVTADGVRPGTVILDGNKGAFVLTDLDRSINIFVSDLTLRGVNHARIENCDDGLFFDDFSLKLIVVEDIAFFCAGDGIEASGAFKEITIRDNLFRTVNNGISLGGASKGWLITGNTFIADGDGMVISSADAFMIAGNHISGNMGIVVAGCSNSQVRNNVIKAAYQGVSLIQESWRNEVQSNIILDVNHSGIGLADDVTGNRIMANRIFCAAGFKCLAVDASPIAFDNNKIAGNKVK